MKTHLEYMACISFVEVIHYYGFGKDLVQLTYTLNRSFIQHIFRNSIKVVVQKFKQTDVLAQFSYSFLKTVT